jgi:radical SAM superfamily enzyme YgiQ (UPF0313 family)
MKVMLISPAKLAGLNETKGTVPVPLLHLASMLQSGGHEPFLYDLSVKESPEGVDANEYFGQEINEFIAKEKPGLIGINCFTSLHFQSVLTIAEGIKKNNPDLPIAVGGAHPSLFPKEILEGTEAFDFVITGEAEQQIIQLVDAVAQKDEEKYKDIQAFSYRKDGEVVHNPRVDYIDDLDDLPPPAWDLLNFEDYYSDLSSWNNPKALEFSLSVPIMTSRACPFTCNFCACFTTMGRKFRKRTPSLVVDEIQMLHEVYGQNYFGFIDDVVNLHKKHFIEILNEIVRRNINIQFETTCGVHLGTLSEDVISAMAAAGCVFARLPIEHGNDEMRNIIIGKHLKREKIYEAVESLKKHNIFTSSMFIMGFPEDTFDTVQDTYDMICDLQLDLNYVFNIIPFPGTKLFMQAQKDNLFIGDFAVDELWKGNINLDPVGADDEDRFFIKPYNMELDELRHFRKLFDQMQFFSDDAKQANLKQVVGG